MITLTYQYKLRQNQQKEADINHIFDVCRSLYNYALREGTDWLSSRNSQINICSIVYKYIIPPDASDLNYNHQIKSLAIAKKTYARLKSVNAQVLQQVLKILDRAFSEMKLLGKGFPRFNKSLRSFVFPAIRKSCLGCNKIKLPQLGWIKIRQSKLYPDGMTTKQIRIVKKFSGYYLMIIFQSSESVPENPVVQKLLGIDARRESFLAPSTGKLTKVPKVFIRQTTRA